VRELIRWGGTKRAALTFALGLACSAFQARGTAPGRLPFRSYGAREGLSNLVVLRLVQDREGFLWAATEDGLFRLDGSRFDRFGNEEGLPSSVISALVVGDARDLWVGTLHGLARRAGATFVALASESGLPKERVNGIAVARGDVWVAMQTGLYKRIAPDRFEPVPGWSGGEATAVWADGDNGLVAAAADGVHSLAASGRWTTQATSEDLDGERIDALVRDSRGVLWARSPGRLWSRRAATDRFADESAHVPNSNQKGTLSLDRLGRVMVPTTEGLAREENDRWTVLGSADGLPVRSLHCALEDEEGSLWVGAIGLHQVRGRGLFRVFGRNEGLAGEVAWTELRDAQGRLWVGTDQGLARDAGGRWETVPATRGLSVRTLAAAPDGALWLGGVPAELLRLAPDGSTRTFDARSGILGKRIFRLLIDRSGTFWVATDGAGLLRMIGPTSFSRVSLPGGTDDERISYLIEDRQGRLWAAGEMGLAVLDGGAWRRFTAADGLRVTRTAYVLERRGGEFCVAYLEGIGLSCFRLGATGLTEMRHIDATNGLPAARVYLLGEDESERLWVGTGVGVAVFARDEVEQFTEAQGLPSDDTAAMSFLAEPNGDVWVGTSGGLSRFSGARYTHAAGPPRATIVSARLGSELDPASPAPTKAAHADNTLRVRFTGLTYLDPSRVEHEVRLRPLERDWHVTDAREARYAALGTGAYGFEARARMPSGRWSEAARIGFVILPAWWQQAWFLAPLALVGMVVLGGLLAWGLRSRETRRDDEVRARHEASFRALFKGLPDMVVVHREGRILYANTAAATGLGWSNPEEMIGMAVLDLVQAEDREELVERVRGVAVNGEPAPAREGRLVRRDGTVLTFEISALEVDFDGRPAVVAVARDVTERRQMQERLLLADRMASVGTLAAGVAHEINNPLSYTIANLGLLAADLPQIAAALPQRAHAIAAMLDDARDGAERVRKIVRGLKAFSRAHEEERVPLDPAHVVDQAIHLAFNEIRHRARLVKDYAAVPPVWADEPRLVQVFINLLVNAAHSLPEERSEGNEIRVAIRKRDAGRVIVEVRDTGSGIPPEIIGRVFDPFFTTKPVGKGTGLGLSICHGIVTRMNGEITVESEVGKGSVFSVVLPVAPDGSTRVPVRITSPTAAGRRGRVLVVDDDLRVAESVRRVLRDEHDVTILHDADTALAHLRQGADYDVVLCDLMMPGMTGMELHERLAGTGSRQVERFVFLTGGAFTAPARHFLEKVPNERLEKPFDTAALRELVHRLVSGSRAVNASGA
jgi:PAS domain S-box-containing protein